VCLVRHSDTPGRVLGHPKLEPGYPRSEPGQSQVVLRFKDFGLKKLGHVPGKTPGQPW
jgi:hypothetical protein